MRTQPSTSSVDSLRDSLLDLYHRDPVGLRVILRDGRAGRITGHYQSDHGRRIMVAGIEVDPLAFEVAGVQQLGEEVWREVFFEPFSAEHFLDHPRALAYELDAR